MLLIPVCYGWAIHAPPLKGGGAWSRSVRHLRAPRRLLHVRWSLPAMCLLVQLPLLVGAFLSVLAQLMSPCMSCLAVTDPGVLSAFNFMEVNIGWLHAPLCMSCCILAC